MFEVAIIKWKRGVGHQGAKIKKFENLNAAQVFIEDINKEDKGIPIIFEYATLIVDF